MLNAAMGGTEGLPNHIDDMFTNEGGYVDGNGHRSPWLKGDNGCNMVDWGAIQRILPNLAHVGIGSYASVPTDLNRIKAAIDAAGSGVILEVRWKGIKSAMHFVLAVGHSDTDILVNDPETGRQQWFSSKLFGSGNAAKDIINAHFFADAIPARQIPAPDPVPAPAAPKPEEEQVTQAQCDAAVAAAVEPLKAQVADLTSQLKTALDISGKRADTITTLTNELANYRPEYVATEQGNLGEKITTKTVIVTDFADQQEPVEVPAGQIFDVHSTFTVAGKKYWRSQTAYVAGSYYGYPDDAVTDYASPASPHVLDLSKTALSLDQRVHAAAADTAGWLRSIKSALLGGKKS